MDHSDTDLQEIREKLEKILQFRSKLDMILKYGNSRHMELVDRFLDVMFDLLRKESTHPGEQ